jgi:hypothetical protein
MSPPDGRDATPDGLRGQRRGQFRFAPTTRATSPAHACATEFRASSSTIVSTSSSVSVGGSARSCPLPATTRATTGPEELVELALGGDCAVAGREDGGEQPGDLGVDGGWQVGVAGDDRAEGGAVGGGSGGSQ